MQLAARRFLLALLAVTLPNSATADLPNYENSHAYDQGKLGSYPNQTFRSSALVAPRFNVLKRHAEPQRGLYTLLSLRGHKVKMKGPMILDSRHHMVWFSETADNTYNLQVQEYNGQRVLTYWSGYDGYNGHGRGYYHVLDSSYNEILKVRATNGVFGDWGDQHEFIITKEGTAVLMIYEKRQVDLSGVDPKRSKAWIWDCLFQEIVISSRKIVFQWRASDVIPWANSFKAITEQGSHSQPWDWFHLNSIDKDDKGNYLLSSRQMKSIFYVSGKDGKVIWTLGGKGNDFSDLSNGRATNFSFQHDARWRGKHMISLFDNNADGDHRNGTSRGLLLKLDLQSSPRTVDVIEEYLHPNQLSSISQGNLQILPASKNVLIGWGYAGAWTEFSHNGSIIEDVRFQPSTEFQTGNVESYRTFKMPWKGIPNTQPTLVIEDTSAYVSWNGATEVNHYMLQSVRSPWFAKAIDWVHVSSEERQGFETVFDFEEEHLRKYIQVVAFDSHNKVLGKTAIMDWRFARRPFARALKLTSLSPFIFSVLPGMVLLLVCLRVLRRCLRKFPLWKRPRRRSRRGTSQSRKILNIRQD